MNYILFDGDVRTALLPFTYTKPVADIRVGILTIREKWEKHLGSTTTTVTEEYLEEKYPMVELEENVLLNASFLPTDSLVDMVRALTKNQAIFKGEDVIAFYTNDSQDEVNFANYEQIEYQEELLQIRNTWDIFSLNDKAIRADFDLITDGRTSEPIPDTVNCINKKDIFIEEGAKLTFATLNASSGPIYIGENAEIMEGVVVRGALAMCENSVLKLGAKIYGATTLGPHCKVGGEVNNSVLMGYSSKGHDGFLGNSVLGEWCNIGADTNNSNLKNNYAEVKLWSYDTGRFAKTGLQFCGLMMGDHSKCGINTMFNTGTVVGVSANIFGSGFPRNFVPSFSWGGASGFTEYKTNKVFEVAEMVMKRRNIEFDEKEQRILSHVFEQTKQYRNY
ncbi:GlmU family protein [Tenacibaculum finnmarkense genomovar finnmarkense]|uniref:Glucose-1-phosphate thymidylyltransferase n=1 Tax=Tenacibaculum finnmarkense genomovar finnmarkense TaxID=1458503 RepID=A0AAP1RFB4_9FLAO|nr:GlmU family protein [Tenacibaculum finnmarkense]MBE7645522.1 glucose-1-phosphate thymidylyltransferase [Tenacibaculum finnmarkense genomovar ulcerans]MBE7652841.1 glucose-1-phosphate thymidylyltransferase [Tenacibaculum finnmarkense genomovar finnmarkense]MBE7659879.1 glucose-1-phosphate thymidylyltransferase [Tenacibaculum finnmarkense genomovar finnmarkense]MBE7692485.1 glucose-1-phosphate thymidylyltransferase [Tenacibaculum finnmarkense genomovar finnmarkense]MBE7695113.1 glucose-1-phos